MCKMSIRHGPKNFGSRLFWVNPFYSDQGKKSIWGCGFLSGPSLPLYNHFSTSEAHDFAKIWVHILELSALGCFIRRGAGPTSFTGSASSFPKICRVNLVDAKLRAPRALLFRRFQRSIWSSSERDRHTHIHTHNAPPPSPGQVNVCVHGRMHWKNNITNLS